MRRFFGTSLLAAFMFAGSLPALSQSDYFDQFPEIQVGQTINGVIAADGSEYNWAGPFNVYRFDAEAGTRYRINLESIEMYPRVSLLSVVKGITDVMEVGEGDYYDSDDALSARIRFIARSSGTYLIVAQAYDSEGGSYQLSVLDLPPPPPATAVPVAVNTTLTGALDDNSAIYITHWDSEAKQDLYSIELAPGQRIEINMESNDFDTYLEFGPLHGNDLEVAMENDDGGGDLNARLIVDAGRNGGTFGIRARSFGEYGEGTYTLRIEEYVPTPVVTNPIGAGQTVEGSLSSQDGLSPRGTPAQIWTFTGSEGDLVIVNHMSDDFDAYLYLGTGAGDDFAELTYDDDSGDGWNSRIEFVLPHAGEFSIIATSFGTASQGGYTLSLEIAD